MQPQTPRKSWLGSLRLLRFRRFELSPTKRRLRKGVSVADLRKIARRRLPRGVFDYIDGGAEDELAMSANSEAYRRVTFRPRVLRDMSDIETSSTLLGKPIPFPLVLAPTGFTRIADPAGELAVARAAQRAGLPYALSTLGTRSIEEVAAVSSGRLWFQVYMWKDRGLVAEMVQRAADSGYEALCLTVDTAVFGKRERDVRRGFTLPPKLGISTILDGIVHPGWTWQFLTNDPILFANVAGRSVGEGGETVALAEYVSNQFDPSLSWGDIEWLRARWDGPIVHQGDPDRRRRQNRSRRGHRSHRRVQPWWSSARFFSRHPHPPSRRSSTRSATASRSSAMAGCVGEATSSRRLPSVHQPAWRGGPISTVWALRVNPASTTSWTYSPPTCGAPWPSSGAGRSRS